MEELTGFQRDILYIIAGLDEPHGMKIKEVVDQYHGSTNDGRLYHNLNRLVEIDLVNKGEKDKRTNCYELTEEGTQVIENREKWERDHLDDTEIQISIAGS